MLEMLEMLIKLEMLEMLEMLEILEMLEMQSGTLNCTCKEKLIQKQGVHSSFISLRVVLETEKLFSLV